MNRGFGFQEQDYVQEYRSSVLPTPVYAEKEVVFTTGGSTMHQDGWASPHHHHHLHHHQNYPHRSGEYVGTTETVMTNEYGARPALPTVLVPAPGMAVQRMTYEQSCCENDASMGRRRF